MKVLTASNSCSTCLPRTSAWCCRQGREGGPRPEWLPSAGGQSDPCPADATTGTPGSALSSRPCSSRHPWLRHHAGPAVRQVFVASSA